MLRITKVELKDVLEKCQAGWTYKEIAKRYPYTSERIRQLVRDNLGFSEIQKRKAVKKVENAFKNKRVMKVDQDTQDLVNDGFKYFQNGTHKS